MADDPLIRSVKPPPRVKDAPKRSEPDGRRNKQPAARKDRRKKNRRHIIDTYA